jgi:hypothetical protein
MKNTYNWVVHVDSYIRKSAEKKIDEDLVELSHFILCHGGPLLVSIVSTDALERSIKGNVRCQCGKEVATFSGASNGAELDYEPRW